MTHDYGEQMSLMLDGRLSARERAALQAHLAACDACRARWAAFQQIDRVLAGAAKASPAPGFAARFATKLARHGTKRVTRPSRRAAGGRLFAGIGVLVAGVVALALLVVPALLAAWEWLGNLIGGASSLWSSAAANMPSVASYWLELTARWLVTLRALGEAGESVASVLAASGGPIVMGYMLMLIVVIAAWVSVMRGASRRRSMTTLSVFVGF